MKRKNEIIFIIVIYVCIILYTVSYIANVVKFIQCDFKAPYKTEIVRGLGITSYGGFIGFFKIGEEKK